MTFDKTKKSKNGENYKNKFEETHPFWWKPGRGELYYSFMHDFVISPFHWQDCPSENRAYLAGNCFRTTEDAETACRILRISLRAFHGLIKDDEESEG